MSADRRIDRATLLLRASAEREAMMQLLPRFRAPLDMLDRAVTFTGSMKRSPLPLVVLSIGSVLLASRALRSWAVPIGLLRLAISAFMRYRRTRAQ